MKKHLNGSDKKLPASKPKQKTEMPVNKAHEIAEANVQRGNVLVEELVACKADYAVISPGSRSTPLTSAVARNPHMRSFVALDERGAAFHALGYARATGKAAVVICTSGSALANYFPAIVEAYNDRVPLIVVSADRPPELRQTGANQTMDQVKPFGSALRFQAELPCPDAQLDEDHVRTLVAQLVYRSRHSTPGPVHLNCQFREPLLPPTPALAPTKARTDERVPRRQAHTNYVAPISIPPAAEIEALAKLLAGHERGVIVLGRLSDAVDAAPSVLAAVQKLSETLNWPVLADVRSAARRNGVLRNRIAFFDRILTDPTMCEELRPQTILHLGDQLCSKSYLQWTANYAPKRYITVKDHAERHDPTHAVTVRFQADIEQFCRVLLDDLERQPAGEWSRRWLEASERVEKVVQARTDAAAELSEATVARIVAQHIPRQWALFSASSMPIRYLDMYCAGTEARAVVANRGVSGIDGIVASAGGYCAGSGTGVTLLIGDLALIHDLNSLLHVSDLAVPLVIVVINNSGGGIFSLLPIVKQRDIFERFFGTPHAADFGSGAQFAGLTHHLASDRADFVARYRAAVERNQSCVIEVRTDREQNAEMLKTLNAEILVALSGSGLSGSGQSGAESGEAQS